MTHEKKAIIYNTDYTIETLHDGTISFALNKRVLFDFIRIKTLLHGNETIVGVELQNDGLSIIVGKLKPSK